MKFKSQYKPLTFFYEGNKKVIKDIFFRTESDLEAHYCNMQIFINQQETGGYYAKVRNSQGTLIVDGYFNEHTSEFNLQKAMEDIFDKIVW